VWQELTPDALVSLCPEKGWLSAVKDYLVLLRAVLIKDLNRCCFSNKYLSESVVDVIHLFIL